MKKCEIKTKCPDLKGSAENNTSFSSSFQQEFLSISSEFTFGDNSDKSSIFEIFLNLVDRDLTEHQITQTLTLSHSTHNWSRQGESECSLTRNKLTGADKVNPTV